MSRAWNILHTVGSSWWLLISVTVVQMVQVPLALAYLSKVEFGLFALFSQLFVVAVLMDMGITAAFVRLLMDGRAGGEEKYDRIWQAGAAILLVQSGLMFICVALLVPFLSALFRVPVELQGAARDLFLCFGIMVVARQFLNLYNIALVAAQKMAVTNWLNLVGSLLHLGVFYLALRAGFQLHAFLWSLPFAYLLPGLGNWLYCRRWGLSRPIHLRGVNRQELRNMLRLGWDVSALVASNVLVHVAMLIFAGLVLPLDQVAVLSVNLKPVNMISFLMHRVPASADPSLSQLVAAGDLGRYRFGWKLVTKFTLAVTFLLCAAYAILARGVIAVWTSADMVMSPVLTALLCLVPLRYIMELIFMTALVEFKAIGRVRWWLVLEIVANAILSVVLGRRYGVSGLLTAYLASLLVGPIWSSIAVFSSQAAFGRGEVLRILSRASVLGAGLVVAIFAVLIYLRPADTWGLVVGAVALMLAGVAGFVRFSLTPEERVYLGAVMARSTRGGEGAGAA